MWVYLLESIDGAGCTTPHGVYATSDRAVAVGAMMEAIYRDPHWFVTAFEVDAQGYGERVPFPGPTRDELKDAGWRGW